METAGVRTTLLQSTTQPRHWRRERGARESGRSSQVCARGWLTVCARIRMALRLDGSCDVSIEHIRTRSMRQPACEARFHTFFMAFLFVVVRRDSTVYSIGIPFLRSSLHAMRRCRVEMDDAARLSRVMCRPVSNSAAQGGEVADLNEHAVTTKPVGTLEVEVRLIDNGQSCSVLYGVPE